MAGENLGTLLAALQGNTELDPDTLELIQRAAQAGTRQQKAGSALEQALASQTSDYDAMMAMTGTQNVPTPFGPVVQRKPAIGKLAGALRYGLGAYGASKAQDEANAAAQGVNDVRTQFAGLPASGATGRAALAAPDVLGRQGLAMMDQDKAQNARQTQLTLALAKQREAQDAKEAAANEKAMKAKRAEDWRAEDYQRRMEAEERRRREAEKNRATTITAARITAGDKKAAEAAKTESDRAFSAYATPATKDLTPGTKTELISSLDNAAQAQDNWAELYAIADDIEANGISQARIDQYAAVAANLVTRLNKVAGLGALSGPDKEILDAASAGGARLADFAKSEAGLSTLKNRIDAARKRNRADIQAKLGNIGSSLAGAEADAFSDAKWQERLSGYRGGRGSSGGPTLSPNAAQYLR